MAIRIPGFRRLAFRVDLSAGICFTMGMALLGLCVIILRRTLEAPQWAIATVQSVQDGILLLAAAWAGASHLCRKVPFVSRGVYVGGALLLLTAVSAVAVQALAPATLSARTINGAALPVLVFLALTISVHLSVSGLTPTLTTVYRHNYPARFRARIVSWLNSFKQGAALLVATAAGLLLDWDRLANASHQHAYVWLLLAGGVLLLIGGRLYRRMPVRGEEGYSTGVNWAELRRQIVPRRVLALLRDDPHFLRFEIAQILHGGGNMLCGPAFVLVLTDVLKMPDGQPLNYLNMVMLQSVVVGFFALISTVPWAPFVDRLSPSRARVYNGPFWIAGMMLFWWSIPDHLGLAYAGRAVIGIAAGGAALLWLLGPLYYAPSKEEAPHYVAAHNFLTGVRGLTLPLVGYYIYIHWHAAVFLVGSAMMVVAVVLYYYQDRAERRDPNFVSEIPTAPPIPPDGSEQF